MKRKLINYDVFKQIEKNSVQAAEKELLENADSISKALGKENLQLFSLNENDAIKICSSTWSKYKPLFHYSESDPGNKNKRAHAEYPTNKPLSEDYDWDIELKAKDKAIRMISLIELTEEAQELNLGY